MSYLPHKEDNYRSEDFYRNYDPDPDGFARIHNPTASQWYFAFWRGDDLIFRSEGYTQEAGRDNGIESVKKYMNTDANYKVVEHPDGKWLLELYAPNHKEIARTCRYETREEAEKILPSALTLSAVNTLTTEPVREREDNYQPDDFYIPHGSDEDGFARFQNDNGTQWYFSYFVEDQLVLRSEGYSQMASRDNGIESVKKHMPDDANYKLVEYPDGKWCLELYAPNHKEIARSCRFDSQDAAKMWLPSAIAARASVIPTPANAKSGREDDYLTCKEYEDHPRSEDNEEFTLFEKDGEYYFTLVSDNDEIQLRSEGYSSTDARKKGIQSVLTNKGDKDRYKTEEHYGYHFVILTARNHKEIARSCPLSEAAALALIALLTGPSVSPIPPVTPLASTTAAAPVASTGTKWWLWLLPLILLLLLFLFWRSCQTDNTGAAMDSSGTSGSDAGAMATAPVYASEDDCSWQPVLFPTDGDQVNAQGMGHIDKVVEVLKEHPDYRALFIGFTDNTGSQDYNAALSKKRAESVKAAAVNMGVAASRISTLEEDEHNPVASNRTEAGRKYNRRVVMFVLNQENHLVCKQVEEGLLEELEAN